MVAGAQEARPGAEPVRSSNGERQRAMYARDQFTYEYGNDFEARWLACRFCGTWHQYEEFDDDMLCQSVSERYCKRWSSRAERVAALRDGVARSAQPTAEACAAHFSNLSASRQHLIYNFGGAEAVNKLQERGELHDYVSPEEDEEDSDAVSDEVFEAATNVSRRRSSHKPSRLGSC